MASYNGLFRKVRAITTRERREDDQEGDYEYLTKEEFGELQKTGQLLIETKYRAQQYGISKSAVDAIRTSGNIPILVVTPSTLAQLPQGKDGFISFFLDATDLELDRRLNARKEKPNKATVDQRLEDRGYEDACTYSLMNESVESTCGLIARLWDYQDVGGILPASIIKLMMQCGNLIVDGELEKVSGASYDLSLGDEYYYNGKPHLLNDQNEFIKLEPHEYVLVRASETIKMPKDIAARFGIKVGLFLQGLIQSNGPQVDPGFYGVLWCLLFNTSGDVVQLKRSDHYSTIEFCKLLSPTSTYKGRYQDKDRIMQYLPKDASRSPIKKLQDDIQELKNEKMWSKVWPSVIGGLIAAAALTVAIISLVNKPS
jgi:deoxycytidine triphosphate deaminase